MLSVDEAIKKAEQKLAYLSNDEETMRMYYERERSLHERANMISSAEVRAEKKAKLEVANNLLDILDDEIISIKTGLKIEEVKSLRDNKK